VGGALGGAIYRWVSSDSPAPVAVIGSDSAR
jgi:hypothetical protein